MWIGDRLVDPVGGGASVGLDGSTTKPAVNWAFPFDRAIVSDDGLTTVMYTVLGTKGLVIKGVYDVREIDRSFYHAHAYEYPVTVGRLFDGEQVLIHCAGGYNQLTVERLTDGVPLAAATDDAADVFHSRLEISPDGRHLLSAGWMWHPYGLVVVYDLEEALRDPSELDRGERLPWEAVDAEVESACWLSDDLIVVSTNPEEGPLDGARDGALMPGKLGIWSLREQAWIERTPFDGHSGTLHAFGDHVLALYDHARLIDPRRGEVLEAWPELETGQQISSIIGTKTPLAPLVAVDADHRRFAVADEDAIHVVQLSG